MERFFGGNPALVLIRLAILSLIVGVVLAALGFSPLELIDSLQRLAQRIYDMGFTAIEKAALSQWDAASFSPEAFNQEWWKQLDDPVLDTLEVRAAEANRDVRIALSRVDQARAVFDERERLRYPAVTAGACGSAGGSTGNAAGSALSRGTRCTPSASHCPGVRRHRRRLRRGRCHGQGRWLRAPGPELVAIIAYRRVITPRRGLLVQVAGTLVDGADRCASAQPQGLAAQRHRVVDVGCVLLQQRGGDVEAYERSAPGRGRVLHQVVDVLGVAQYLRRVAQRHV